jgi:hypothetical protein
VTDAIIPWLQAKNLPELYEDGFSLRQHCRPLAWTLVRWSVNEAISQVRLSHSVQCPDLTSALLQLIALLSYHLAQTKLLVAKEPDQSWSQHPD